MYVFCPCEAGDFLVFIFNAFVQNTKRYFHSSCVPAHSSEFQQAAGDGAEVWRRRDHHDWGFLPDMRLMHSWCYLVFSSCSKKDLGVGLVHHWACIKTHLSHIYWWCLGSGGLRPVGFFVMLILQVVVLLGDDICAQPSPPSHPLRAYGAIQFPVGHHQWFQCHPTEVSGGKMGTIPCLEDWWKVLKTPYRCLKHEST